MHNAIELAGALRQQFAIGLKAAWISECLDFLKAKHPDLDSWGQQHLLQAIFGQFLLCDLNLCGEALLPPNVQALDNCMMQGKFVLQVDEVVNIATGAKDRYTSSSDGTSRMLKFVMTDGCQRVTGIEYRSIKAVTWEIEAGSKVLVHDVQMRKGVLLLQPHNLVVLGGAVERLEQARLRAVACWNKPAGGKRPNDPARDIFGEARAAAWSTGPGTHSAAAAATAAGVPHGSGSGNVAAPVPAPAPAGVAPAGSGPAAAAAAAQVPGSVQVSAPLGAAAVALYQRLPLAPQNHQQQTLQLRGQSQHQHQQPKSVLPTSVISKVHDSTLQAPAAAQPTWQQQQQQQQRLLQSQPQPQQPHHQLRQSHQPLQQQHHYQHNHHHHRHQQDEQQQRQQREESFPAGEHDDPWDDYYDCLEGEGRFDGYPDDEPASEQNTVQRAGGGLHPAGDPPAHSCERDDGHGLVHHHNSPHRPHPRHEESQVVHGTLDPWDCPEAVHCDGDARNRPALDHQHHQQQQQQDQRRSSHQQCSSRSPSSGNHDTIEIVTSTPEAEPDPGPAPPRLPQPGPNLAEPWQLPPPGRDADSEHRHRRHRPDQAFELRGSADAFSRKAAPSGLQAALPATLPTGPALGPNTHPADVPLPERHGPRGGSSISALPFRTGEADRTQAGGHPDVVWDLDVLDTAGGAGDSEELDPLEASIRRHLRRRSRVDSGSSPLVLGTADEVPGTPCDATGAMLQGGGLSASGPAKARLQDGRQPGTSLEEAEPDEPGRVWPNVPERGQGHVFPAAPQASSEQQQQQQQVLQSCHSKVTSHAGLQQHPSGGHAAAAVGEPRSACRSRAATVDCTPVGHSKGSGPAAAFSTLQAEPRGTSDAAATDGLAEASPLIVDHRGRPWGSLPLTVRKSGGGGQSRGPMPSSSAVRSGGPGPSGGAEVLCQAGTAGGRFIGGGTAHGSCIAAHQAHTREDCITDRPCSRAAAAAAAGSEPGPGLGTGQKARAQEQASPDRESKRQRSSHEALVGLSAVSARIHPGLTLDYAAASGLAAATDGMDGDKMASAAVLAGQSTQNKTASCVILNPGARATYLIHVLRFLSCSPGDPGMSDLLEPVSWPCQVAGTFQATQPGRDGSPTLFTIEDGTAALECVLADSEQRLLFGGRTLHELDALRKEAGCPSSVRELLASGSAALKSFYGIMELELTAPPPPSGAPGVGVSQGSRVQIRHLTAFIQPSQARVFQEAVERFGGLPDMDLSKSFHPPAQLHEASE